jgi:hypothetical protein
MGNAARDFFSKFVLRGFGVGISFIDVNEGCGVGLRILEPQKGRVVVEVIGINVRENKVGVLEPKGIAINQSTVGKVLFLSDEVQ